MAGTGRMNVKMAEAVALAKIAGQAEVDQALGTAAIHGRFANKDLASILGAAGTRTTTHAAGETRSPPLPAELEALMRQLKIAHESTQVLEVTLKRDQHGKLRRKLFLPDAGPHAQRVRVEFVKKSLVFTGEDSLIANLRHGAFAEPECTFEIVKEHQARQELTANSPERL